MAFVIAYDLLPEDKMRATLVVGFQVLMDTLLASILALEVTEKTAIEGITDGYRKLMCADTNFQALDDSDWGALSFGAGAAILAAALVPIEAAGNE
jgi:hypothetical protein